MPADEFDIRATTESVAARLRGLRKQHPEVEVATDLVRLDETLAVVRAAVALSNGGSASGFGVAGAGEQDAVEVAENRAIDRALTFLGYGVATVTSIGPSGRDEPAPPELVVTPPPQHDVPRPEPVREPVKPEPMREAAKPEPVRETVRPEPVRPAAPIAAIPAASDDDDPPLEDYSWTEFWKWARSLGYDGRPAIETAIGQSIAGISPADVRVLLREKTGSS
jgi:hypothetical protein